MPKGEEMDLHNMEELVRDAVNDADLQPSEIPSIDLYLDQITSLADEKRHTGSPRFFDRELTKTMINNYSKDGLLEPIKGKKYSRTHILQMLLVYSLKNTLSMGEIKRILQNVYQLAEYDGAFLERAYEKLLAVKAKERENAWDSVEAFLKREGLDASREEDFLSMVLGLCAISSYTKSIAQALVEAHYPTPDEKREMEERERRETAKRIKEERRAEKEEKRAERQAAKVRREDGAEEGDE